MNEAEWLSINKKMHVHEDIVIRMPTISIAARVLMIGNKNLKNSFSNLIEMASPTFSMKIPNIMDDIKQNTRNI